MPVLVPEVILDGQVVDSAITVTWRDVLFDGGMDGIYGLSTIDGWSGLPDADYVRLPRTRGHGNYMTPVQFGESLVTITGYCRSGLLRDQLFRALAFMMTPTSSVAGDDLTVDLAGEATTRKAQLLRFAPVVEQDAWLSGKFPFAVQWRCPDPRRYGLVQSASTTLQQPGGGITPPFTPPLVLPERPAGGFVSVSNDGNAPTPPVIVFTGPQSRPGVVNRTRGLFQSYALDLDVADTLMVDVASGRALLNGNAYRAPAPGSAVTAEFELARGVNDLEVLGSATGVGSPGMSVSWKPAWW